jgi:signal peptidase II
VRRSLPLLLIVAAVIVGFDYATKQWVMANLTYERPVDVLGPFVRLTYTRNSGIAFGLGAGSRFPFYVFSIVAALAILYLFVRARVPSLTRQIALSLIFAGAIGNLIDRVRFGEVVDFIQIGTERWYWPVFNVADAAVTVGVVLFALTWSGHHEPHASAEASPSDGRPPDHAEDPDAGTVGAGAERGGAAGPVSRGGAGGSVS